MMDKRDYGFIHEEGFISLTYDKEFDVFVLIIYYNTGSFNDTKITLHKYDEYDFAKDIFENEYYKIKGVNE